MNEKRQKKTMDATPQEAAKTETKPETGLAKRSKSEMAIPPVTGLVPGVQAGLENVEVEDIVFPRIVLTQKMSKAVNPEDAGAPKPGQWFNTLTREVFDSPLSVIPVFYAKGAIKFGADPSEGLQCRSRDGVKGNTFGLCRECEYYYRKWETKDDPPECCGVHEFVCVRADDDPTTAMPFVVSFMKTGFSAGSKWLSVAKLAGRGVPLFGIKYDLNKVAKDSPKGSYYVPTVTPAGRIADPTKYIGLYEAIYDAHQAGKTEVQYDLRDEDLDENGVPNFPPKD